MYSKSSVSGLQVSFIWTEGVTVLHKPSLPRGSMHITIMELNPTQWFWGTLSIRVVSMDPRN